MEKIRCQWVTDDPVYTRYHDMEWGVEVHDDHLLFESLVLDGAQAGLSWLTILRRRENYRLAFDHFDPLKISRYTVDKIEYLMKDRGIIRNRKKIESAVQNAKTFLRVLNEFPSFDQYLWQFVGGKPIINKWKKLDEIPATSPQSHRMSRDLKKRGFSFVGPTICYAFMQAVGMVNDHTVDCFRYGELLKKKS
ncbi:MAG: DNA-3-methyladenine glycosylase I [Candidatus Aminicenantes bacterium]|nr:DNA-3-methyladenine glycosylase I [Candidatus Aminicenantes bacterium]